MEWLVPGETLLLRERVAGKTEGECSAYPVVAGSEKDPLPLHDRLSRTNGAGEANGVPPFDEKVLSVCFQAGLNQQLIREPLVVKTSRPGRLRDIHAMIDDVADDLQNDIDDPASARTSSGCLLYTSDAADE